MLSSSGEFLLKPQMPLSSSPPHKCFQTCLSWPVRYTSSKIAVPSQIRCILGSAAKAQVSDSKESQTMSFIIAKKSLPVSLNKTCLIALFRNWQNPEKCLNDAWQLYFFWQWNIHISFNVFLAYGEPWKWLYVQFKMHAKVYKTLAHVFYPLVEPINLGKSAMHLQWILAHSDGGGWRSYRW